MRKTIHVLFNFLTLTWVTITCVLDAKQLPPLTSQDVMDKTKEIMGFHASQKELTPALAQRILLNYIENLDHSKTYFLQSDINLWIQASDTVLNQIVDDYHKGSFLVFEEIQNKFAEAILRRRELEKKINYANLPKQVKFKEFKDISWANSEQELLSRLEKMKAIQFETLSNLQEDMKSLSLQRMAKRQTKYEEDMMVSDSLEKQRLILSQVLKATASGLDSHTVYFTPTEASQFMIDVQQRLHGVGAQLRDDISGFTVTKLVEGGPALLGKQLKTKDRIIAVDGVPVIGMDIADAVELIRGEANTPVVLTVIRKTKKEEEENEEKLDITVMRGEVVLKESRYKSSHEPYGNGIIGYLKLYSFYQDEDGNGSSSAEDLEKEIQELKKIGHLQGIVLDLRSNSGGLLSQAVAVTSLFISKGVVVSIKDENGRVQHLRDLNGSKVWDGPLLVLINRMSASASEIVAQTLQDYGRAIVVGDDHTFGKGSFQTFTLGSTNPDQVNSLGEYKVTRGRYYTVSGKSPQLKGVESDIPILGIFSQTDIGERFGKYPLENDQIKPNFDDDLSDIPFVQRDKVRYLYKFGLQEKETTYLSYLEKLRKNATLRLENNQNYQNLLKEAKKKEDDDESTIRENFGQNDLQLEETYHIMKDLIVMMSETGTLLFPQKKKT